MIESFGGKKPYFEDSDLFEDQENDPFAEEPVNLIIKNKKKTKDKSKKSKKTADNFENQENPDVLSMF